MNIMIQNLHNWATPVLAQQQASEGPLGILMQFLPLILIFVAFWFLLIAPQRKKQKAHVRMLSSLGTGDEVLTSGGIYGVITNVKEDRFVIKIADNTRVEVGKSFVQGKVCEGRESK